MIRPLAAVAGFEGDTFPQCRTLLLKVIVMERENVNGQPAERLWLNCGILIQGPAADIDRLLAELPERGLKLIYKKAGFGRLRIIEDTQNGGGQG